MFGALDGITLTWALGRAEHGALARAATQLADIFLRGLGAADVTDRARTPVTLRRALARDVRAALAPDLVRFAFAAIVAALVVALVAGLAFASSVLPTLLDPEVPARVARPILAGVVALALETGAVVGWPIGWVEACVRSRERGEARARMALGESPWRRIAGLAPTIALLAILAAAGSVAWGRDARAPGRLARGLVAAGEARCREAIERGEARVVVVPVVHVAFLCAKGERPWLVGQGAGGAASVDFAARALDVADNLSGFELTDAQLLVPAKAPTRVSVHTARVTGLSPYSTPSSVPPWLRATALVLAAMGAAIVAMRFTLTSRTTARAALFALALAGPAAALATLRACERAHLGDLRLLAVPLAAIAAATAASVAFAAVSSLRRA